MWRSAPEFRIFEEAFTSEYLSSLNVGAPLQHCESKVSINFWNYQIFFRKNFNFNINIQFLIVHI